MSEAGYSGTPLPQKLGIKPESNVDVVNAPRGFSLVKKKGKAPFDIAIVFPSSKSELKKLFVAQTKKMTLAGGIWIAWPKKSSGVKTDIDDNVLREVILKTNWVDNKVCAINEIFSGLRFVLRVTTRK
jgi:hypothetical protein